MISSSLPENLLTPGERGIMLRISSRLLTRICSFHCGGCHVRGFHGEIPSGILKLSSIPEVRSSNDPIALAAEFQPAWTQIMNPGKLF
ncbi:MAG: hypothetical protein JRN15_11845 [Nitrososphaerota archaeon]|nr:hypothetical protein [Nitrososphaerota archaeon]